MAAAKVLFSLEYTAFWGLKSIPRTRCSLKYSSYRFISSGSYLAKDRIDSGSKTESTDAEKQNEKETRTDLERLKELLFKEKYPTKKSDNNILHSTDQELVKLRPKQTKPKTQAGSSITQITDMLSSIRPSPGDHSKPPSIAEEKIVKATQPRIDDTVKIKLTPSVEADKFREVLSALGQDSSTAEEVIMAGHQISSDSRHAMEGAYNIKQRQYQDKDKRKKMAWSSLKTGPRIHMFDEVREKWSHKDDTVDKSIFREMAEKEVEDLGMSATVQSGFHDLMDNVHRQWTFPVDNEICKAEEEDVSFDEHVFLEHLLVDFPKTGNIRQFMELVVTGLQQNPHLNVQDKREHIEWFREYFQNMPDEQVQL